MVADNNQRERSSGVVYCALRTDRCVSGGEAPTGALVGGQEVRGVLQAKLVPVGSNDDGSSFHILNTLPSAPAFPVSASNSMQEERMQSSHFDMMCSSQTEKMRSSQTEKMRSIQTEKVI